MTAAAPEVYHPSPEFSRNANCKSLAEYNALYDESIKNPSQFWDRIARNMHWETPYTSVGPDYNFKKPKVTEYGVATGERVHAHYFANGTTNLCYNCVDRHVRDGKGDKVAFIWEGNDITDEPRTMTYSDVLEEVQVFANVLKNLGVKRGSRVAIYMPMVCELPLAMLACCRVGAVHSVVFGGFAPESLASRCVDARCDVVVTADAVMRGAKKIDLKAVVDEAAEICKSHHHAIQHVLVYRRLGSATKWDAARDVWYHEARKNAAADCPVEWVGAEDPLFMLYTSGSTGTPKGVLHTTGGYMVGCYATCYYVFDLQAMDVYWCTADCGWITGHSYITYGPMLNGATQVLYEGVPTHPHAGRLWEIVQRYGVTILYTAPTLIRALMAKGDAPVKKFNRDSLRLLGTVGEPINPEAWRWFYNVVGNGRCPIVDTWWQTETGVNMLTSIPGATHMKPGCATKPFFGVEPVVIDVKTGKELYGPASGFLCIRAAWPSMFRTLFGNHDRYESGYFGQVHGYYFTGDGCRRDEDGDIWITGRVDDVINVSGHRIGTAEVESVFVAHGQIAEAAAIGYPHPIKGEGIYVYAVPKAGCMGSTELAKELVAKVRHDIGAFAAPDIIHWAPQGVPKTRSGKIMRRVLRKIATNREDELGDLSTLADPSVVKTLIDTKPKRPGKGKM